MHVAVKRKFGTEKGGRKSNCQRLFRVLNNICYYALFSISPVMKIVLDARCCDVIFVDINFRGLEFLVRL